MIIGLISAVILLAAATTTAAAVGSKDVFFKNKSQHKDKACMKDSLKIKVAAEILGKTTDELKAEFKNGKTLGDLLLEAKKLDDFKVKYLDSLKIKLDTAVKEGKIKQEEADEIYKHKSEKIKNWDGTTKLFDKAIPENKESKAKDR